MRQVAFKPLARRDWTNPNKTSDMIGWCNSARDVPPLGCRLTLVRHVGRNVDSFHFRTTFDTKSGLQLVSFVRKLHLYGNLIEIRKVSTGGHRILNFFYKNCVSRSFPWGRHACVDFPRRICGLIRVLCQSKKSEMSSYSRCAKVLALSIPLEKNQR